MRREGHTHTHKQRQRQLAVSFCILYFTLPTPTLSRSLLSAGPVITLSIASLDTALGFDFLVVDRCSTSFCRTPETVARVSGRKSFTYADSDSNNLSTATEFQSVLPQLLGLNTTEDHAQTMIDAFDLDGDRGLSKEEYERLVRHHFTYTSSTGYLRVIFKSHYNRYYIGQFSLKLYNPEHKPRCSDYLLNHKARALESLQQQQRALSS